MTFKEFLTQAKTAFYQMVINAVGSTTFLLTIIAIFLAIIGNQTWQEVLATVGIVGYAANRTARTIQTAGK
jgi:hypothetical protein